MSNKKDIRIINHLVAEEERKAYALNMSASDRINYLMHLREVNLGKIVREPMKRIITILPSPNED